MTPIRDHWRLPGARELLSIVDHKGIPDDRTEWEPALASSIRGLYYAASGGGRTLHETAAQLRTAADLFIDDPGSSVLENIPRTVTPEKTPAVLREIAEHLDTWKPFPAEGRTCPVRTTATELEFRFPRLSQILPIYFGQDGLAVSDDMSDATTEEGIAMVINEAHPACPWHLPAVAGECYEALATFQTEERLDLFFTGVIHGGSSYADFTEFFPMLAQACIDHMTEFHPVSWDGR
ncbi:hypothetical protein [Streptomyces sp. NBC_00370]|uniref:hypothetical protein n=1 Tax=Streptomyces sp. NBC_00370 TaxID=2975728 RepID=UPI0026BC970B